MRLNYDCVRDVMLWAENLTSPTSCATYLDIDSVQRTSFVYLHEDDLPTPDDNQRKLLNDYSNEVLVYHLNYCIKAGLLEEFHNPGPSYIAVSDLTPAGHNFMANIRNDSIFNTTKKISLKLGIESLSGIVRIAEGVVTETIKSYLSGQSVSL